MYVKDQTSKQVTVTSQLLCSLYVLPVFKSTQKDVYNLIAQTCRLGHGLWRDFADVIQGEDSEMEI